MIPAPSVRQLRFLRALSLRWQRRIIFIAGGLCVGLAAIGLAAASDRAQALFHELFVRFRYAAFIVTPLGFGAAVYLTNRFFPNTQGSGIPQAIAAREIEFDRRP